MTVEHGSDAPALAGAHRTQGFVTLAYACVPEDLRAVPCRRARQSHLAIARPEQIGFASWAELELDECAADNPLTRAMDLYGALARARAAAALDTARRVDRITLAELAAVDGSIRVADLVAAARR